MLKKLLLLTSSLYSTVLTVLSLVNKVNDSLPSIKYIDKVYHVLAYFIFTALWYYTFYFKFNFNNNKSLLLAFTSAISFGIIIEILQGAMTQSRQSDVNDVVANIIGAVLASLLIILLKKRDVK